MKKIYFAISCMLLIGFFFTKFSFIKAQGLNQQPTISIPTVTGTPKGVTATVPINQDNPVNVRSGPGVFFEKVGVLLPGQEVPVRGRTAGGDWVMIDYPGAPNNIGWIYTAVVQISPGELPIIEPPSTPTPILTQTINPTLAAQFISTPNPTRLPTYTPSGPFVIPTYEDISRNSVLGGIPMGLIILIIGSLGGLLAIFSVIRNR